MRRQECAAHIALRRLKVVGVAFMNSNGVSVASFQVVCCGGLFVGRLLSAFDAVGFNAVSFRRRFVSIPV